MRAGERGYALIIVMILLVVGSVSLTPVFRLAYSAFNSLQIQREDLQEQYARDAGAEFAIWQLLYGDTVLLEDGESVEWSLELNGVETEVVLRLQAVLGEAEAVGAEDNKIRVTTTVVCASGEDSVFDDDCLTLPAIAGLQAQFTVFLDQVSPDTSEDLVWVIEELPSGVDLVPGSIVSSDGSFPEIESTTPTDILGGGDEFWMWDFAASPVTFLPGEIKEFTFTVDVPSTPGRYCNDVWLKLEDPPPPEDPSPNEKAGKSTDFIVGSNPPEGCKDGGFSVNKYTSQFVALPGVTHIVTYIANVENLSNNPEKLDEVKDVLPVGGFTFCSPTSPPPVGFSCQVPMFKEAAEPFKPPPAGDFNDITGFTDWVEPVQTYDAGTDRWTLQWVPSGNVGKQGSSTDVFIVRFQAHVTPVGSGSYYNEIFVDSECPVPASLKAEGITKFEYCATYSWPTGGVVVPTYDVSASTGGTTGQGNVTVGVNPDDAELQSWHVN